MFSFDKKWFALGVVVAAAIAFAIAFFTADEKPAVVKEPPKQEQQQQQQQQQSQVPTSPQGFKCAATVDEFKDSVKKAVPIAEFYEPGADLSAEIMKFYNSIPPASNVPTGKRIIIVPPNENQPRPYMAIVDNVGDRECVIISGFFGPPIWKEIQKRWPNV